MNPIHRVGGSSTPSEAPKTHDSCSTVSDRPNAEARDSSGRSSWMDESRHTFPIALVPEATRAATAAAAMLPKMAARTATTKQAAVAPTTMFVAVTTSITAFKVFDTVAVITQGRDGTEVLLYAIYLEGFQYFKMGYAAALTVIFLAFMLAFSIVQAFQIDRRVHY